MCEAVFNRGDVPLAGVMAVVVELLDGEVLQLSLDTIGGCAHAT